MTSYIAGVSISIILMLTIVVVFAWFWLKKNIQNKRNYKKGLLTEKNINEKLGLWANINDSLFIPSSIFKYHGNKIFEIDGLLLTTRALICIEIKNINATSINGFGNEKEWVKTLGQNKHMIKSPILQNDKHIEHIVKMTEIKMPMVSLIIFDSNSCKEIEIQNIPKHVVIAKSDKLEETLSLITSALIPRISKNEIQKMYEKLMSFKTKNKKDKELLHSFSKEYNEKTFTI